MNNKEKTIIALIAGWTTIHIIFLFLSVGKNDCVQIQKGLFWPLDNGSLICLYDKTEFLTYVLPPIVAYIVYKLLGLIKTKK